VTHDATIHVGRPAILTRMMARRHGRRIPSSPGGADAPTNGRSGGERSGAPSGTRSAGPTG
jgi:hypothetical protein